MFSIGNYLSRNETTLPSTFLNSSLTSVGTLNNLISVSGNFTNIGGYNSFNKNITPIVISNGNRPFYFNRRTSADDEYNCLDFMSWNGVNIYTHVATFGYAMNRMGLGTTQPQAMIHATGSAIIGTNLTVSGTLQSPVTSLLTVSSNVIDGKTSTLIGTSLPNYLKKTDTTLGLGNRANTGYSTLEIKSNQTNAGGLSLLPKTDNTENSIYFTCNSLSQFQTGVTGTWVVGNNIASSANDFSIYNPYTAKKQIQCNLAGNTDFNSEVSINGSLAVTSTLAHIGTFKYFGANDSYISVVNNSTGIAKFGLNTEKAYIISPSDINFTANTAGYTIGADGNIYAPTGFVVSSVKDD